MEPDIGRDGRTSLLLAVHRAAHRTAHALAARVSQLELTPAEVNVLANLADGAARTVSEVGTAAGSRPTTLTSVLDRLERRDYITRGTRASDRRVVVVELTPAGRETAATVRNALTELEQALLGDLPPIAVKGCQAVLETLASVPQ